MKHYRLFYILLLVAHACGQVHDKSSTSNNTKDSDTVQSFGQDAATGLYISLDTVPFDTMNTFYRERVEYDGDMEHKIFRRLSKEGLDKILGQTIEEEADILSRYPYLIDFHADTFYIANPLVIYLPNQLNYFVQKNRRGYPPQFETNTCGFIDCYCSDGHSSPTYLVVDFDNKDPFAFNPFKDALESISVNKKGVIFCSNPLRGRYFLLCVLEDDPKLHFLEYNNDSNEGNYFSMGQSSTILDYDALMEDEPFYDLRWCGHENLYFQGHGKGAVFNMRERKIYATNEYYILFRDGRKSIVFGYSSENQRIVTITNRDIAKGSEKVVRFEAPVKRPDLLYDIESNQVLVSYFDVSEVVLKVYHVKI